VSVLVIDASVFLAWALPDELNPVAESAMGELRRGGGIVPGLWPLEVANILAIKEKKGRLETPFVERIVNHIGDLPIQIDSETAGRALSDTMTIARRTRLTVYDASYLELASRRKLVLATLDTALAAAAVSESVAVFAIVDPAAR